MEKLLSVLIIVFNQEKYVEECINSVLNQAYKNIEVIVVDDGSLDNSVSICEEIAKKDSRVKVISKENGGPLSARKAGVKAAKGEYVAFLDGDDWVENDLYERAMKEIQDADYIAYGLTCVYDNGQKDYLLNNCESGVYEGDRLKELKNKALYFGEFGKFGVLPSLCAKIFRKSLIEKNIFRVSDDVFLGEDASCSFPTLCDANKIVIDSDIRGYMYRKTVSASLTSHYRFDEFYRIEKLFETLYSAFTEKNANYMFDQFPYYLAFLLRNVMIRELSNLSVKNIKEKFDHLSEIKKLKWIEYVTNTCDNSQIDGDTALFVRNIKNPLVLMVKWYSRRIIK